MPYIYGVGNYEYGFYQDESVNRKQRRSLQKMQKEHLRQLNLPDQLTKMPSCQWPGRKDENIVENRIDVFISKKYMVQVFQEKDGIIRLSINRTAHNGKSWEDNLTWDELQVIKNSVGFSNFDAVEIYPRDEDVVNISNIRHLFIVPELLDFAWRKTHG